MPGQGYFGFQVMRMITGIFGFEIFDPRILLVGKFVKFFWGWLDLSSSDFSKNSEDLWLCMRIQAAHFCDHPHSLYSAVCFTL